MAEKSGSTPKYKGKPYGARQIVALGEHKGMKWFSRAIPPVVSKFNLPLAKPSDLETTKGDIVYLKRGSLYHLQYKILVKEQTKKGRHVTYSIPVPQGFPLYKLKKLFEGKADVVGIRTPLGVTHPLGKAQA